MWLPLEYTYHRNKSVADIQAGQYDNLRIFTADSGSSTFTSAGPFEGGGIGWSTAKGALAPQPPKRNQNVTGPPWLFTVSAACKLRPSHHS
eukprot:SAG31_NODE_42050_length_273_cov_0.827586_1_plen_90_part_11